MDEVEKALGLDKIDGMLDFGSGGFDFMDAVPGASVGGHQANEDAEI